MYEKFFKRLLDFVLSLLALIVLSPLLLVLTVAGTIAMQGNPFFVQPRPGKKDKNGNEVIFNLLKFRTMTNQKDQNGNLLPDDKRLTAYGRLLRATSLDELPQLLNIIAGDMAIVGPRALAAQYLPYYTKEESRRHDVRPGLTGLAQVSGRNGLKWEEKFSFDVEYADNITFKRDISIILKTVQTVFMRENIGMRGAETLVDFDKYRREQMEKLNVH